MDNGFSLNGLSVMNVIWTMFSLPDSVSEMSLGVDNGFLPNGMPVMSLAFSRLTLTVN